MTLAVRAAFDEVDLATIARIFIDVGHGCRPLRDSRTMRGPLVHGIMEP